MSLDPTLRNIRGTFDILPQPAASEGAHEVPSCAWQHVEQMIREVLERFNFREIRTPILEPTPLIARGVGQLTDIVAKEMFAFRRGETDYVLRPELTAPVMRAYLQHRLDQQGSIQKLYYLGPCFRAENPQKGRYRQFHQFGVEVIGAETPEADAEVIAAMMAVYEAFGLRKLRLRLNALGDADTRPRYKAALQAYLEPYAEQLSAISRKRLETNPLRILDTKDARERRLLENAPRILDFLSPSARAHYEAVKAHLQELGIAFVEDPFLVRGLDYYTHTTFELESPDLGAQSALAGGGRYDLLAQELGHEAAVPAIGFAAGIERLLIALQAQHYAFPEDPGLDVFLVALGQNAARWSLCQAQQLRREGLRVDLDLKGRSMKAQMREANRQQARYAVIVGEEELLRRQARVRDMRTGQQHDVAFDELSDFLKGTVVRLT